MNQPAVAAVLRQYQIELNAERERCASLAIELERAKEDRNRAGMEERRKYLPILQDLAVKLTKEREALSAFLVPWKHSLDPSWLDHFEKAGSVTFSPAGYVKAVPVEAVELLAALKLKAADRDQWQEVAMNVAAQRDRLLDVLRVATNTVECASLDKNGNELPWYKMAQKELAQDRLALGANESQKDADADDEMAAVQNELTSLRRKVAAAEGMAYWLEQMRLMATYENKGLRGADDALTAWREANSKQVNTRDALFTLTKRADVPPWTEASK